MSHLKIAIVLGSTRPGRKGEAVAHWVLALAKKRTDALFELVDLKDQDLPLLDEPGSPSQGLYTKEHTKAWSARVAAFDAFVFVTPEYNHSTCAALKNAIDYLNKEWANKVAGFVGYGAVGGVRAVEHLRQIMAELQVATVRAQVGLSLFTDFKDFERFTPAKMHVEEVHVMLDQVVAWGTAMKPLHAEPIVDDHNVLLAEGIANT
ncbi:MAG: NAD(P)H-dependent oxidoreductase [Flavobacteriales bacterium]